MHFERPFKMHKIIFFSRKEIHVPTLPKIFRAFIRNTLILFLFGLVQDKGNIWLENAWDLFACKTVVKSQVLGGIPGSKANVCT